ECKLQEYSLEHGQARSQFVETKVHKPKAVDLGPRIILDDERCVLCTRCIRFTKDIAGDDALGIVNRGSYNTIAAWKEGAFDNNYTLNTVDICPVGALTSKDFRFQMRVWFLKETKSLCTSCGTGCNIIAGSREGKVYRYEPRENDAVNGPWMCDAGRLNYRWINRDDRLKQIVNRKSEARTWPSVIKEISNHLNIVGKGTVAIIASGRQSTEELYLLKKLAEKSDALTEIVARKGDSDKLLVDADKNPNTTGAWVAGITTKRPGFRLSKIAEGIKDGSIRTLIVFGEDVTKAGIEEELLDKLDTLIVSDILPNKTTAKAHYLLPGCAHLEKRGTFINVKGRLQKFMQGIDAPGDARAEWEFLHELVHNVTGQNGFSSIEGLFNQMTKELPALEGITWAGIGHHGVEVKI
ncbi:MAG TPA: NADH-quinone oxidoreductase subunit L, partial [Verrucomicrobiales bacterium]|nr:NADH-quinone oxidoreductase subunit L [Verrucomicrobiales bacterium]